MKREIFRELLARRAAAIAKDRVYVDDPSEAPEGVSVREGDRGGLWYPSSAEPDTGDDESQGGQEGTTDDGGDDGDDGESPDTPEPVQWDRPDEGELDEYVEKVQESEWWSDGHQEFKKSWEQGENTENEHTHFDDDERVWDEERSEQHQEWAQDLLNEDARVDPESDEDPVGVILLGPPGAGKGWWQEQVEEGAYDEDGFDREFTHISSDKTKEPIPEYNGENASYVHDEASHIAKEYLAPEAIDRNHNVVVDKVATSPESTKRMIENMREQGYDIRASFVDVPPEKSAYNVVQRYHDEGRFTPLDYTVGARDNSWESFQEITEDIPDEKVGVFNNDVEWGNPPEPVEVGDDLFKEFMRRLAQKHGYNLLTTFTEVRRFMCAPPEDLRRNGRGRTRTPTARRERRGDSGVDGRAVLSRSRGGDGAGERRGITQNDLADAAESVFKEWVEDPTEQAPNRWTNTQTGEHRYQETQPGSGEGGSEDDESDDSEDAEANGSETAQSIMDSVRAGSEADIENPLIDGLEAIGDKSADEWPVHEDVNPESYAWVPVENIDTTQEEIDLGTVAHKLEQMRNGEPLSPAVWNRESSIESPAIQDGNHTVIAGWLAGYDRVPVDIPIRERYDATDDPDGWLYPMDEQESGGDEDTRPTVKDPSDASETVSATEYGFEGGRNLDDMVVHEYDDGSFVVETDFSGREEFGRRAEASSQIVEMLGGSSPEHQFEDGSLLVGGVQGEELNDVEPDEVNPSSLVDTLAATALVGDGDIDSDQFIVDNNGEVYTIDLEMSSFGNMNPNDAVGNVGRILESDEFDVSIDDVKQRMDEMSSSISRQEIVDETGMTDEALDISRSVVNWTDKSRKDMVQNAVEKVTSWLPLASESPDPQRERVDAGWNEVEDEEDLADKFDPMVNGHQLDPGTGEGTCEETGETIEAEMMSDLAQDCPHCGEPLSVIENMADKFVKRLLDD